MFGGRLGFVEAFKCYFKYINNMNLVRYDLPTWWVGSTGSRMGRQSMSVVIAYFRHSSLGIPFIQWDAIIAAAFKTPLNFISFSLQLCQSDTNTSNHIDI